MTDPMFLAVLDDPQPGGTIHLEGDEGRHAAAVRRIRTGEVVLIADGAGTAVRGPVTEVDRAFVTVEIEEVLTSPAPTVRYIAVQALAKGDRGERAVEVMTEMGVDEIVPWRSSRAVVKWAPDRTERHLMRWRAIAREATKQSRRFRLPIVSLPVTISELVARVPQTALTLVLHEDAPDPLSAIEVPGQGDIMIVIGPEGGIAPDEADALVEAGARLVNVSDGVLRTSTAGVVALAQLQVLGTR